MRAPVLVVPGRERYHEVTLAIWAVLLGLVYLVGGPRSPAIAASVSPPWSWIFATGLLIGGVLTLGGSYWLTDVERGLDLERAGLIALTGALPVYVAAVFATSGWPGLTAAGLAAAWTWANVRRAVAITQDLRLIRGTESG
ncbi:MAG: hypothetical protein ABW000_07305 [Actinoplanes sp.]